MGAMSDADVTPDDFAAAVRAIARAVKQDQDRLSRLDGAIGDGDHGSTMAQGWSAAAQAVDDLAAGTDIAQQCQTAAKAFLGAVGASAGPLYATALMRGGKAAAGKTALDGRGLAAVLEAAAGGIRERGKAAVGDKTMLDAWDPAARAAREAADAGHGPAAVAASAAGAAEDGLHGTESMVAQKGRASRLAERSAGHLDPGAASAALALRTLADSLAARG
jgi:dihydroxyacetone kinase phosphoprotein-dependent L subunit